MNIAGKLKAYEYKGTVRDCSLVKDDMIKVLGKKRAEMLMWALDQFDYFVIPSTDLNKGRYILVDRGNLSYMEDDFFATINKLRDNTVNAIKYYIAQNYIERSRGLEMIEGIA